MYSIGENIHENETTMENKENDISKKKKIYQPVWQIIHQERLLSSSKNQTSNSEDRPENSRPEILRVQRKSQSHKDHKLKIGQNHLNMHKTKVMAQARSLI